MPRIATLVAALAVLFVQTGCDLTLIFDGFGNDGDDDDATVEPDDEPAAPAPFVPEPLQNAGAGVDPSDVPGGVLLHSGELVLERTDLKLAGRHIGFQFGRTWRSGRSDVDGPLGFGWDSPVFARIEADGDDVVLHAGTGRAVRFAAYGDGYASPAGLFDVLRRDGDGHALRHPDGTVLRFDDGGRVVEVEDRRGSALAVHHGADGLVSHVIDELGRRIDLTWNDDDCVAAVTDFDGRSVAFTYEDGFLVEARSPVTAALPDGARERYVYERTSDDFALASNLVAIVGPNEVADSSETPWHQSVFGDAGEAYDRVVEQTVGGTNGSGVAVGGTLAYAFDFDPEYGFSQTLVIDRNGNETRYTFDDEGHTTERIEEPAGAAWTSTLDYDEEGRLLSLTAPLGNAMEWTYDAEHPSRSRQGDVLAVVQLPDPDRTAGQAELRQTFTWDPIFGQPLSETAPEGHDPAHVAHDGTPGSPERYTRTWQYDWMEAGEAPAVAAEWDLDVDPSLLGRGDLNGDGRTDQAAGNAVRIDDPTVTLLPDAVLAAGGDATQEIVTTMRWDDLGNLTEITDPMGYVDAFSYLPVADGGWLASRTTDVDGVAITTSFAYDARGNIVATTDPRGHVRTATWDERDQPIAVELPKVHPDQDHGYRTEAVFDAAGYVVTQRTENWTPDPVTGAPVLVAEHPWFEHHTARSILGHVVEVDLDAHRPSTLPPLPEPERLVTQWRFDPNGNTTEVRSPLAVLGLEPDAVDLFEIDARDQVVSLTRGGTSAFATTERYVFDDNGNLVGTFDGRGNLDSVVLDGFDRAVARVGRDGTEVLSILDAAGRVLREEVVGALDGSGAGAGLLAAGSFTFDELGRNVLSSKDVFVPQAGALLSDAWVADIEPSDGMLTTHVEHDANGRKVFITDDFGATWAFEHDGADRKVKTTNPLGAISEITLDASSNPVEVREIRVETAGMAEAADVSQVFVYNPLSQAERMSDAKGNTFFRAYDSRGYRVATWDARGAVVPDDLGLVDLPVNERGNPTFVDLDGIGRPWQVRRPLTMNGESTTPVDAGHPFTPEGVVATLTIYDPNDNVVARVDGMGAETHAAHDPIGRLVAVVNPDGGTRTFEHDANGNVVREVDENGSVHTYGWDLADRMVSHDVATDGREIVPGVPMLVGSTAKRWGFDGLGRMTLATDDNDPADPADDSVVEQRWSSLGQRIEEVQDGAVVASSFLGPRLTEIHYPGTDRVVHLDRNELGVVEAMANPTHIQIGFTWENSSYECCDCCGDCGGGGDDDGGGGDDDGSGGDGGGDGRGGPGGDGSGDGSGGGFGGGGECGDGGGGDGTSGLRGMTVEILDEDSGAWIPTLTVDRTLDENLLVASQSAFTPICDTGQFSVERNRNDDVVGVTADASSPWSWIFRDTQLDLDSLGRPTQRLVTQDELAFTPWGFVDQPNDSFTGTLFGADQTIRVVDHDDPSGFTTEVRDYSPAKERLGGELTFNGGSLEEEARDFAVGTGLRTADADFLYSWDGWNRLRVVRSASDPTEIVAEFDYDAHPAVAGGRRIRKTTAEGTTHYLWKDDDVLEERVDGVVARQYIHGPAKDQVVAMDVDTDGDGEPETMYVPVRDHQGSTTHLIAADGTPVELITYDGYGVPTIRSADGFEILPDSAVGFPYLYAGRYWDADLAKYYQRARFYDPAEGEFLSRDPIGFWGDGGNLGNPMAYANNRPDNMTDPSGLNSVGDYIGWFWEAWKETYTDPMAERACRAMEEDGGNTTTGYAWAVGEVTGAVYVVEAIAGNTIEGKILTGTERGTRGAFGLAMTTLTVSGFRAAVVPRGPAAAQPLYSYSHSGATGTSWLARGGRMWATPHAPGPWLTNPGFRAGLTRFVRTGTAKCFPSQGTIFQFSGNASRHFAPVRHGLLWKSLGGQYCSRVGVVGLRGMVNLGGQRVLVLGTRPVMAGPGRALIGGAGQALEQAAPPILLYLTGQKAASDNLRK